LEGYVRKELMKKKWSQLGEIMGGVMEWRWEGNEGGRGASQ